MWGSKADDPWSLGAPLDRQWFIFIRPWHPRKQGKLQASMLQVLTHTNTECVSFLLVAHLEDKDYRKFRCFLLGPCFFYIHAQPLLSVRFSETSEPESIYLPDGWEPLVPKSIPCCSADPGPHTVGMLVCLQTLQALSFILVETPGSHCDGKCVYPRILFLSLGSMTQCTPGSPLLLCIPIPHHVFCFHQGNVWPCWVFLDRVCHWKTY